MIDRTVQWAKAMVHWLTRAKAVGVWLVVVGLVCVLESYIPRPLDDRLRYMGLTLEVFGIFVVISGLNERLRHFHRPTLIGHVRNWLASRPPFPSKHISGTAVALSGESIVCGLGEVAWGTITAVDTSPEARLGALEKNVKRLIEFRDSATKLIGEQERQWKAAIAGEQHKREMAIQEVRSSLETFGVGGFQLEAIGTGWLLLGAILATLSKEISSLFKGLVDCGGPPSDPAQLRDIERICEQVARERKRAQE